MALLSAAVLLLPLILVADNAAVAALLLLLMMMIKGRTIVCSTVLPLPELATTPLALANQQLSLLGRTCLTRPSIGQRCSIIELSADANP